MPSLKKSVLLLFALLFSFVSIFAQEAPVQIEEAEASTTAEVAPDETLLEEVVATEEIASESEVVAEAASETPAETAEEAPASKAKFDFIFGTGNFTFYDRQRLAYFYSDYFGFLNLPLKLGTWKIFNIPIPAGVSGIGLEISGLDILGSATTIKIPFGGGVKVMSYNRGIDGNAIEYAEGEFGEWWNEDFWHIQNMRREEGKKYVESQYDVAFAEWGLEWYQNVKAPNSPGSNVNFYFAYKGSFQYWLEDNNPLSEQLLFQTDFPDKEMSVLNKLIASISYSHTQAPNQRYTHGLSDSISTSFRFEIAPGVMNPNVYGNKSQKKDRRGNPYYWYINESILEGVYRTWRTTDLQSSEVDFGTGGKPFMEYTPTADYYFTGFNLAGQKTLWDIAPDKIANVFSGKIQAWGHINWTSELGWDGYIPLVIRSGSPRFNTGFGTRFTMYLPEITILDLKAWSTPQANIDFAQAEDAVFGFLNQVGLNFSREQFNVMPFLKPRIETGFDVYYYRDYDGNFANFWAERDYQFARDNREGYTSKAYANLIINVAGLLDVVLGFHINFNDLNLQFYNNFSGYSG